MLYLKGDALPGRGAITSGRMPFASTPSRWTLRVGGPALAVLAAAAGLFWFTPAFRVALSDSLVGMVVCLSVVVITGFVGQISLSQMTFAGVSALAAFWRNDIVGLAVVLAGSSVVAALLVVYFIWRATWQQEAAAAAAAAAAALASADDDADDLDDVLAQSFPASDPPSSTSGIARVLPVPAR